MQISKKGCTLESTCITEHFRTFLLQSFFTTTSISLVPMEAKSCRSLSPIVHLISDGVGLPPLTLHLKVFFSFSDRIKLPGSSKLTQTIDTAGTYLHFLHIIFVTKQLTFGGVISFTFTLRPSRKYFSFTGKLSNSHLQSP